MGRPTKYNDKRADEICKRLALGESLLSICDDAHLPTCRSVYRWLNDNAEFRHIYTRAREAYADHMFDGMSELAKTATPADVQCIKLQVDTLKWILARMSPRKYGDHQQIEHTTGPSGFTATINWVKPKADE